MRRSVEKALPAEVPEGFELLSELGRGSAAVVWRAHYALTDEEVALKLWSHPLLNEHQQRRFANECRWHRELSAHPNIVDWVWASSPTHGNPWIATRPFGASLAELLRREGAPPLDTALQLSLDLLDGLAAMHRRGLIHRDIKPSNLLVLHGRGVLCDLGIAMPVTEVTREWRAGTPGYVAPELEDDGDGAQPPDRRSDVWAAAATISRMIGSEAPHPVDHLVHAVAASERRSDRPADADDFARRLRAAILQAGIRLGSVADDTRPGPTRRRVGVFAGGAAAAALTGAALLSSTVIRPGDARDSSPYRTAVAALQDLPDIGPRGQPMVRDSRAAGRCAGQPLPGGLQQQRSGGRVVAEVRVYYDERGQACAKLVKTPRSGLYNQKTYLALSLCNAQAQCDYDWNRYRIDAGPVTISAVDGCVVWRVSAENARETQWLLRDQIGSAGCSAGVTQGG